LPAPEDPEEFAALMVAPQNDVPQPGSNSGPEIVMGAVIVRLEPGASVERIAAVVRALVAGT
jgi:transposase